MSFNSLQETIGNRQLGLTKLNNNRQLAIDTNEADQIIQLYTPMIDPKYVKWFYKQLYRIGTSKFIELAERAKSGNHPQRLFTSLLRKA